MVSNSSRELSVVGKSFPMLRWYGLEKTTGSGKFVVDMKLPGMLYAKIVRSPYAHAKILNINTRKAEALSGVKAVISKNNTPKIRRSPFADDWYLFDDKVRFSGETVAAVAATSRDVAEEAVQLVDVKYKELQAVFDAEEATSYGAPQIHPVKNNIGRTVVFEDGDVNKGFEEADYIFEDIYQTQAVLHCNLEPKVCLCSFDQLTEKLTVWTATQTPFRDQIFLAQALGMPLNKINYIVVPHIGGSFGGRGVAQVAPICALLAMRTGRSVKFEFTREQEFYAAFKRHPSIGKLKTGVKKTGILTARYANYLLDTGAYADMGPLVLECLGQRFCWIHRCPNIKFEGKMVYTNTTVASAMRGFGEPQAMFAVESQMDKIAEELEIDPMELRLKNHIREGDTNMKLAGLKVTSCGLSECIRKGSTKIGWERRKKQPSEAHASKNRGIGMGLGVHVSGEWPGRVYIDSSFIKANADGTFNLILGAPDMGQGRNTTMAQIAAEELGVILEDIHVVLADTDTAPFDGGSNASRSTYTQGNAVKAAALNAKKQLLEVAAKLLKASVEDLEIKDGRIYVKGNSEKGKSIRDIIISEYSGDKPQQIMGTASTYATGNAPSFGATFAEVEVDTETGQVKVLKLVSAVDMGKAINPMAVEGQVEGSIQMGLKDLES
jgi:xanthine dehydrogenase molybdenum-binding subunit